MAEASPGQFVPRDALRPGLKLVSQYRGMRHEAEVIEVAEGKLLVRTGGKEYPSLSSAARSITGHRINGWRFWRLADSQH